MGQTRIHCRRIECIAGRTVTSHPFIAKTSRASRGKARSSLGALLYLLNGLMIFIPGKCFSLSVTTMHPFATATAATIMSVALFGLPEFFPFAMISPQMSAAFSSNGNTRSAKRLCGPWGLENHCSSFCRFLPVGISNIPRHISAIARDEMNRFSSSCSLNHAFNDSEGCGLVRLLRMQVSSK